MHWGEWCEPDLLEDDHFANFADRDFAIVATAYFAYSAAHAGRHRPDPRPRRRRRSLRRARGERASTPGRPSSSPTTATCAATARPTSCARSRSISCPTPRRDIVADQLVAMVRAADTHLNTGFLATPYLLPVLADTGHLDLAYELLLQDTPPSWLAMIDRGATTIWEHWEGIDADGVAHASLNHYSKGAVISFLHQYVAGIQLLDDGPRTAASASRPAPAAASPGRAPRTSRPTVASSRRGRSAATGTTFTVQVPPNTEAEVVLPDGRIEVVGPDLATFHTAQRGRWSANERLDVVERAALAHDDDGATGPATARARAVDPGTGEHLCDDRGWRPRARGPSRRSPHGSRP